MPDALWPTGRNSRLADRLGQSVTIENRPGGGTTIATKAGAMADPDGYTLLQASSALLYTTVLYPNAGYDPLTSFAPVATLASWSHFLVVPASIPADTVEEFVAYAKANPGQLNIGFPLGAAPQVLAEMFKTRSRRSAEQRALSSGPATHRRTCWATAFTPSSVPARGWCRSFSKGN